MVAAPPGGPPRTGVAGRKGGVPAGRLHQILGMIGNTKLVMLRKVWSTPLVERAFFGPAEHGLASVSRAGAKPFWHSGIFFVLSVLLAFGADAAPIDSKAQYVVSLAGINVASVDIRFTEDDGRYAVDLGANVSGVGTLVASGTATANWKARRPPPACRPAISRWRPRRAATVSRSTWPMPAAMPPPSRSIRLSSTAMDASPSSASTSAASPTPLPRSSSRGERCRRTCATGACASFPAWSATISP